MLFRQIDGWTYEYFPPDEDFTPPAHAEGFITLWRSKRKSRVAPALSDYDWDELKPWWGAMVITDLVHDPFDYRYRMFGTKLAAVFDTDVTGMRASQLIGDKKYEISEDIAFYQFLYNNPSIVHTHGVLYWQDRDHIQCDFVEVPLSDDGVHITNIMSVFKAVARTRVDDRF